LLSDKKNLQIIAIKFIADCVQKYILHPSFEIELETLNKYHSNFAIESDPSNPNPNTEKDKDIDTNQPV